MRIKFKIRDRAVRELTSVELNVLIYLTRRQDIKGLIQDVNVVAMSNTISNSRQGIYNALYSLERKKFIHINDFKTSNFDILIIDNSFAKFIGNNNEKVDQYLNLNFKIFEDGLFYLYNMNIKNFLLKIMSFNKFMSFSEDKLKELKVFKHLDILKKLFKVYKVNNVYVFKDINGFLTQDKNVQYRYLLHKLRIFANKYFKNYDFSQLDDIVSVVSNNHFRLNKVISSLFKLIKYNKGLNPKLFNAILYDNVKYEVSF